MAQTTIEQFATDLKMPAGALLEQLTAAGVAGKKQGDKLTEQDKTRLLDYLRKQHGAAGDGKKRITLTRKQTSEIKASDSSGKARTIQVEVRKKRVLVRREEDAQAPVAVVEEAKPAAAPVLTAEEIAAREAEERKAQELIARQQEDLQKKQAEAAKRKTKKEREAEEAAAKAAATGEGVKMMQCSGHGELFVADQAAEVQVMYLENDMISVNGENVLAFSNSIQWDIHRIQARGAAMTGGLYNVSLRGTGYVAVTTKGDPVALDVASAPTFADAQAVVLWTSGVTMDVRIDTGGIGSMIRGGTGELVRRRDAHRCE